MSIQDLQPNPQDTSNFYLANIYQAMTNPNTPNVSCSLPASPPPFSPPNYAVWVNALWFLCLVISITCALLATLQQQWARRYLKVTQSRYSPHKRARIRAFFAEGIEKCLLPWVVETLPTLLHISLFLFFAGLVVFLWNVNLTIFKLVLSWVAICTALYGCITVMPIIRYDSPYYTSLSSLLWRSVIGVACFVSAVIVLLLYCTVFCRRGAEWLFDFTDRCYDLLLQGMQKRAEETALNSPSEIDTRAVMWTFDCLDEDHELERFFSGLPGLRSSKVVKDPLPSLSGPQTWKLCQALTGLMDRTFSSDFLPAPVKERRAMICAKAIDPVYIPNAFYVLDIILARCHYSGAMVPGILQIMRGWGNNTYAMMVAQATVSSIVARAHRRDEPWVVLASDELGIPEASVRDCAAHHGDSLSLAILIHVIRQQFTHFQNPLWPRHEFSFVLSAASKLNVQDTSPELQREFCALWNQIVCEVQYRNDLMTNLTLGRIRNVYIALHQDTDCAPTQFSYSTEDEDDMLRRPSSYPLCNIPDHHPYSTTHVQDVSASETLVQDTLHDHDSTALFSSSLVGSDLVLSSTHAPFPVDEIIATAPPLDDSLSLPVQTTPESRRVPSTSSNILVTTRTLAIHGSIDASPKTVHLLTPEPSVSTPPSISKASTSPTGTVAVEHTTASHITSGDLNVSSLVSPDTAFIDAPPTGLLPVTLRPFHDWI